MKKRKDDLVLNVSGIAALACYRNWTSAASGRTLIILLPFAFFTSAFSLQRNWRREARVRNAECID